MKILQIIPAPGWYARTYNEGKENEKASSELYPLLHWALVEVAADVDPVRHPRLTRRTVGIIANYDSIGWMEEAEGMSNFVGYEFHPDATPVLAQIVQGGNPKVTWETRREIQRVKMKVFQTHLAKGAEIETADREHTENTIARLRRQRDETHCSSREDNTE